MNMATLGTSLAGVGMYLKAWQPWRGLRVDV